jgi:hypothetical protein
MFPRYFRFLRPFGPKKYWGDQKDIFSILFNDYAVTKIDVDPQIFLMKSPQNSNFYSQFFNVPGGASNWRRQKKITLQYCESSSEDSEASFDGMDLGICNNSEYIGNYFLK